MQDERGRKVNKDEKLQITKDKLITATMLLMDDMDDPFQVTSRQIAAKADVRPAMINYCFGSREDLIFQVFQRHYADMLQEEKIDELLKKDMEPKEFIKQIHFIVAKYLVKNYKFTKAITAHILFKRDLSKDQFSLPYVIRHYDGKKSEKECRLITYELSSMMQLLIFRKDDIKRDFDIDLDNEKELKKYIDMRVDLLLGGD